MFKVLHVCGLVRVCARHLRRTSVTLERLKKSANQVGGKTRTSLQDDSVSFFISTVT